MAPSHAQLAVYDLHEDVGHGLESTDPLKRAIAGWLARYKGDTLADYTWDFELYLDWCAATRIHPLQVGRGHLELYIRWLETQTNHFTGKPWAASTMNRRFGTEGPSPRRRPAEDPQGRAEAHRHEPVGARDLHRRRGEAQPDGASRWRWSWPCRSRGR